MSLVEILPIAGALSAPAFFLVFALAALGAPLLALVCLAAGQLRSTQYIEAYSRRLLRMALTAALPALFAFAVGLLAALRKAPWILDWTLAAPMGPGLLTVAMLAFFASLVTLRLSKTSARHARQGTPLGPAFILALLVLCILWLGMALCLSLAEQAQAVLRAPVEGGIGVAPLLTPDASALPPLFWPGLGGLVPLCAASAGALSQEYLLALSGREPFGREALAQMLRIAGRSTLRASILSLPFLAVLWAHLPESSSLPGALTAARLMIGLAGGCAVALCLTSGTIARSGRPWTHSIAAHLGLLSVWLGATALLTVGMLLFYSA
ncbi:MAG: hypothetical protein HY916_06885 [Desulfovibrio sp.]|jgi:hypothetical protein|nr:hypothetical protein [Desulfovibrio sp.]